MADSSTNLYAGKTVEYFSRARTEIEPLLPKGLGIPFRALEIGCSEGHTLEWLKNAGYCNWTAGVEPYAELRTNPGSVDQFFKLDIEKTLPDLPPGSIDLMLCLDVLEHLVNPWETIRRLDPLLKPGGFWIISVPNVRNYHILVDLAFKGKFSYTESGILDRTHLRFFTRASAIELAESAGAKVTLQIGTETNRWQKRLLTNFGLGDLLAKQFILVAQKQIA
ncbi:MAG: class I SAM-dependent methyltransferase [Burkholderiales bacterium]|nr:class I SAM-dependent methyltransferase [Burkholderiales bacterium]